MLHFTSDFHINRFIRSQVCRVALIKSALESSDPGAFNDVSNVEIEPLGAVLSTFKVVELLQNLKKTHELFQSIWKLNFFKSNQIGLVLPDFRV